MASRILKFGLGLTTAVVASGSGIKYYNDQKRSMSTFVAPKSVPAPLSRSALLQNVINSKGDDKYDMVIVGGGSSGAGVALDATTRGLKVLVVEKNDFASGTSSKSTKMVHGGVRYLEKAFWELDYKQFGLVSEALYERETFLNIAPHLTSTLPIIIPVYKLWQLPYLWAGCKMYDAVAWNRNLKASYVISKKTVNNLFPTMKTDGMKAALVYHDGSFNDARMNVSLALTAAEKGATILNYFEVVDLKKDQSGKLNGLTGTDRLTGEKYEIETKSIVNCTGPFADNILRLDDPSIAADRNLIVPSSGVHVTFPSYLGSKTLGLLDPATPDGRVLFFLPWQGQIIAGTTDNNLPKSVEYPKPEEADVKWIIEQINSYLNVEVTEEDVLSSWSGIRPLVRDLTKSNTESLVRSHLVVVTKSNLVSLTGGKWTTYRQMAEDAVDKAIEVANLKPTKFTKSQTTKVKVIGSDDGFDKIQLPIYLSKKFQIPFSIAEHLSNNYGTRSETILSKYNTIGQTRLINPNDIDSHLTIAELLYSIHYEYTVHAADFLMNRSRLAFLNLKSAKESLPTIIDIMGDELHWNKEQREKERLYSEEVLKSFRA